MKGLSNFAVKAAREKFGISLDYSENSLIELDKLLEVTFTKFNDFALEGKLTEETIQRTSRIWGSYLGEVFLRKFNGEWIEKDGEDLLRVNENFFEPILFVRERITNKSQLSAVIYFEECNELLNSYSPFSTQHLRSDKEEINNLGLTQLTEA